MLKKINSIFLVTASTIVLLSVGCKKGTFDINSPNPNVTSAVDPKLVLPAAMTTTAVIVAGNPGTPGTTSGNDLFNVYMGYWAVSGDYIPNAGLVQYVLNTDFGASIWDMAYPNLKNYNIIENTEGAGNNYRAIAKTMKALLFSRLVDIYNNIPYTDALNGGTSNFPAYDNAESVYKAQVDQLDSAVLLINSASAADAKANGDIMFGGKMSSWKAFANTVKLKILMHLTQASGGTAYIQSKLSGMTTADFIGTKADAGVDPGYSNDANNHQNPLWNDIGSNSSGTTYQNNAYFRANSYAVNFYQSTNDPRDSFFYSPNSAGAIQGRPFGSTALEHNDVISGIGGKSLGKNPTTTGSLQDPGQPAYIITSTESLFLQAEAVQRGFLPGNAAALYQSAVEESFRLLGVANYATAAATYTAQAGDATNFAGSSNPIKTIITQKWAALNTIDPVESWSDWRRLGIPSNLPVSIYPGTTAPHIPYRLLYPTSEYNYNGENVSGQGNIDAITSKIFWMP